MSRKKDRNTKKGTLLSLMMFLGLFFVVSCDNDSGTKPDESAMIRGQVVTEGGFSKSASFGTGVEGATVILARVESDGSLQAVSDASVMTNAQGEFTLETDAEYESNLVLEADKGDMTWKAVLSSEVEAGETVTAQPMTMESTSEADIYVKLKQDGNTDKVNYADVLLHVTAEHAARIEANGDFTVEDMAAALVAGADARAEVLADASVGASQSQRSKADDKIADATVQFEASLFGASSTQSARSALNTFLESKVKAYVDVGITASDLAKAEAAFSTAMEAEIESRTSGSGSGNNAVEETQTRNNENASFAITAGVEAELEALGLTESEMDAAVTAGNQLKTTCMSASLQGQVDAYANYQAQIQVLVDAMASAQGGNNGQATFVGALYDSVESGLETTLDVQLGLGSTSSSSPEAIATAYVDFYTSVEALVEANWEGASDAEVQALANVLILTSICNE